MAYGQKNGKSGESVTDEVLILLSSQMSFFGPEKKKVSKVKRIYRATLYDDFEHLYDGNRPICQDIRSLPDTIPITSRHHLEQSDTIAGPSQDTKQGIVQPLNMFTRSDRI